MDKQRGHQLNTEEKKIESAFLKASLMSFNGQKMEEEKQT